MRRLGLVDLGSNTARLVVYAYEPGRWFRLEDEIREPVRLGEGLGRDGELSAAAVERATAALELFSDYRTATRLEQIEVLATSAVRDAGNREAFLARVQPLGLPLTVLSGEEEAELATIGVANGFTLRDAWVVDVGGGSIQIGLMRERLAARGGAYPLGAVRLTEAHSRSDPPGAEELRAMETQVAEHLGEIARELKRSSLPLVALGGSLRNLARAAQKREGYPLDVLHGYFLRRSDLERLTAELATKKTRQRVKVPGVSPDRADVIVAAAVALRWLLRQADRDGVLVSGYGLREGRFFQRFLPAPHVLPDLRGFTVRNLQQQYDQTGGHVARVRKLAGQLFSGLRSLHELGPEAAELLDAAAATHDLGMSVGYHRHHKHGAYLLSTASLPGFSHREQALLALLTRFHRHGAPRAGPFKSLTQPGDKRLLLQLGACLRLAEQLERSRAGRVGGVRVEIDGQRARVLAEAAEEPFIELWEARKHSDLFEQAFGRQLVLERAA